MKNLLLWLISLILFLILVGAILCPILENNHNHFIGSGSEDIIFLGKNHYFINPDEPGSNFNQTENCFNLNKLDSEGRFHFHADFNLQSFCRINNQINAEIKPIILINGVDQTSGIDFEIAASKINNTSNLNFLSNPSSITLTNVNFDTGTPCEGKLIFEINIPGGMLNYSDKIHLILEVFDDQNFETYASLSYDNNCSTLITNCINNNPSNDLQVIQCYENLNCEVRDRYIIIEFFPICEEPISS